jgi:murein DD-endopeptidase MepM/ murein hydrolase activator NlpD
MILSRRGALLGLSATGLAACSSTPRPADVSAMPPPVSPSRVSPPPVAMALEGPAVTFSGHMVQGGALIGQTWPAARVVLDDQVFEPSYRGQFVCGFDRDAPLSQFVTIHPPAGAPISVPITLKPGDFDVQRVDGLPQDTVTPEAPETLAKIAAEAERKAAGFASRANGDWFGEGFAMPVQYSRVSGRFGGQRILNGTPSRPHYGADLAAPTGTPVHAPCGGIVSFAETGLHFEGGLIMIDHGQGLVTAYLHLSKVEVQKGQTLERGQKIGEVGAEGRATGPHLCWRMKWRNRNLDPMLLVGVAAP